jgi:hypothetical protein
MKTMNYLEDLVEQEISIKGRKGYVEDLAMPNRDKLLVEFEDNLGTGEVVDIEERLKEILESRYPDSGSATIKKTVLVLNGKAVKGFDLQVDFEDGSLGDEFVSATEL